MKTIFKILSLVLVIMIISCDRPLEDTDYLLNRTPLVGFQGTPDVIFLTEGIDIDYEIIIGISAPIDTSVSYTITNDVASAIEEGVEFDLESDYTIDAGDLGDAINVHLNYDALPLGASQLFLNLEAVGNIEIGQVNQFDLNIIKLPPPQ